MGNDTFFHNPDEISRCRRCILPANYPGISFNDLGVCNYCLNYKPQVYLGEESFVALLNTIREKGSQYDCLVPVSGGRDSTYVLYQMKKTFGVNVVAYNYNNGFASMVAKDNIERAISKLDVDSITLKSKRDIQRRHLRHLIAFALRKSPHDVLTNLCSGCANGIWGGAYMTAKVRNIPLVVFGESRMESGTAKQMIGSKHRRRTTDKIRDAVTMPLNFIQRKSFSILLEKEFPLHEFSDIKKVNFFDYLEWDEEQIERTIREKTGWRGETGMSSWRFDCKIHALVDYMYRRLYGFTEKTELYSKMVREGKISRDEALKKVAWNSERENIEQSVIENVFDILHLNTKERNAILRFETL